MKQKRKYGLFFKKGKRWIRLYPKRAYTKDIAIRVFQSMLLELTFRGKEPALRPLLNMSDLNLDSRHNIRNPEEYAKAGTFAKMEEEWS